MVENTAVPHTSAGRLVSSTLDANAGAPKKPPSSCSAHTRRETNTEGISGNAALVTVLAANTHSDTRVTKSAIGIW